jgi:hypothetical protein
VSEGRRGTPWSIEEVDATVGAYFAMLERELRGEPYRKTDSIALLAPVLPDRTHAAIELKFQNISAVLDEEGFDWIDGYKPMSHYQQDLRTAVMAHVGGNSRIGESISAYEDAAIPPAMPNPLATEDLIVPAPSRGGRTRNSSSVRLTGSAMSALRDFKKRRLGEAGEALVLDLEREHLDRAGRRDLADEVRWVAQVDGDGAGYDIQSFRPDGSERLIEVKTTNLGIRTPFYITRWEVEVSARHPNQYSLYRLHGFNRDPRIYVLDGSVRDAAVLEPKVFLGLPK